MAQHIREVMTTPAATRSIPRDAVAVRPDDELPAVVALMRSAGTTVLPVVDGARTIGTVSLDDLLAVLLMETDNTADPYYRRLAEASAGTAGP
ncbi:CBS domain-containing protein [Kribbella sp. NPDC000426]|uniref:CBS domain-containing protein n=1 Tax=Kribbella sp. NPDC000426 TaxID=3154255 RepID=UPI003323E3FC